MQPDPERYLIQNWIIAFPNGKGAYEKDSTGAEAVNWHAFRAPDQEWERTHYQRQSRIEMMVQSGHRQRPQIRRAARPSTRPGARSCRSIWAPGSTPNSALAPR